MTYVRTCMELLVVGWWWPHVCSYHTTPDRFFLADPEIIYNVYKVFIIIIIPQAWVGSESIAHEIGYWLRGHKGERNNYCFSKIQLVGQKYQDKTISASKMQFSASDLVFKPSAFHF